MLTLKPIHAVPFVGLVGAASEIGSKCTILFPEADEQTLGRTCVLSAIPATVCITPAMGLLPAIYSLPNLNPTLTGTASM
jgi:hypothetical protein